MEKVELSIKKETNCETQNKKKKKNLTHPSLAVICCDVELRKYNDT